MATLVGSTGGVLWLVAVLLVLTAGLTAALLAATRSGPAPRGRATRRP
jgi:hypothetical protein